MKYYFLKLKDDFFTSEKVIALESCPKGSTALLALIKMQSLSLKKDGVICMTENKGFSEASLAAILRINKDDIQDVLNLLVDFEFISIASNKVITILDFENLVMSETKDAERKRAAREKKKQEQLQQQQQQQPQQEPIQNNNLITVDPTIENQSQSKSNNQFEEAEEEQEPVYDNQIALISCVEEKPENSENFMPITNSSVPPKTNNFSTADNVWTRPENVRQILEIRDKILEIRNKSVCNIISTKPKNLENFEEKILTHTQEQKLIDEFGNFASSCIKKFKAYCVAYSKSYQDPYSACRYWILQDLQKREMSRLNSGVKHAQIKDKYTERHYDQAFYDKLLKNSKAFLEG